MYRESIYIRVQNIIRTAEVELAISGVSYTLYNVIRNDYVSCIPMQDAAVGLLNEIPQMKTC